MSQNQKRKGIPTYNLVIHDALRTLDISANEYCIVDSIDRLSQESGWCYASKEHLGRLIGVSKPAAIEIIKRMMKRHLLEQDSNNRVNLRSTSTWRECVYPLRKKINSKESLPTLVNNLSARGTVSLPQTGKDSLLNNDNTNKEKINGFSSNEKHSLFSSLKEKRIELAESRILHPNTRSIHILEAFSDACFNYTNMRPVMKTEAYFVVIEATKRLNPEQMRYVLSSWFKEGRNYSSGQISEISCALSTKRLNKLELEDPKFFARTTE